MVPKVARVFLAGRLFDDPVSGHTVHIHLAKTIPSGDEADWELEDLEECDFDGYAEIESPVFEEAILDENNRGKIVSPELVWTATEIVDPQTIRAVYTTFKMSNVHHLVDVQKLAQTVTLANTGEQFKRKLTFYTNNFAV